MKFFTWARRLLRPGRAARPVSSPGRVMHLMGPGFAPACGLPTATFTFLTRETPAVTCPGCRVIANRLDVRREVSLR